MTLVALYLAAIVTANLAVTHFGPGASIVTAFLFIGLDLTTRDALHDKWRGRNLPLYMAGLITAGGLISYLLNHDARTIALASSVAFMAAAAVDTIIYTVLREQPRLLRMNGSNIPSAFTDSLIFPALAFGGLLWPIVLGQFAAKVGGGFLWSLILNTEARGRALPSEPHRIESA